MRGLLTDEHRAWIGREDPPIHVEVSRREIVKYAIATEQVLEKYLRGDEAPPMFIFNLFGALRPIAELRADGLPRGRGAGPKLPLQRVMAGGMELIQHRPIRPGDRLTGTHRVVDMYQEERHPGIVIDGPLQGDWLAQCVTNWLGNDGKVLRFNYSNRRACYLGETLTSGGRINAIDIAQRTVTIELHVKNAAGDVTSPGGATVALNG